LITLVLNAAEKESMPPWICETLQILSSCAEVPEWRLERPTTTSNSLVVVLRKNFLYFVFRVKLGKILPFSYFATTEIENVAVHGTMPDFRGGRAVATLPARDEKSEHVVYSHDHLVLRG
jgi:hypothetical protein